MPTGAGKSLTFQIPARGLPGTVLALSPLISLMKDQVDALPSLRFRATAIDSTLAFDERRRRLAAFRRGELELALACVSPHIVCNDATLRAMAEFRPTSHGGLLGVPGVGPAKVERYGDAFLEVLGS